MTERVAFVFRPREIRRGWKRVSEDFGEVRSRAARLNVFCARGSLGFDGCSVTAESVCPFGQKSGWYRGIFVPAQLFCAGAFWLTISVVKIVRLEISADARWKSKMAFAKAIPHNSRCADCEVLLYIIDFWPAVDEPLPKNHFIKRRKKCPPAHIGGFYG